MCSRIVHGNRNHEIKGISDVKFVVSLGQYLGFPFVKVWVSHNVHNDIFDIVSKKLAHWKGKLLNKIGRACIVKLVSTKIHVYIMQIHYLINYVYNMLDGFFIQINKLL